VELLISAKSRENGTLESARCSLNGALTLGRGTESPLLLDGIGISREHLRIQSDDHNLFITDLSSNGTWLNEHRLVRGEPYPFTPADAIQIPGFDIRIEMPEQVGSPPRAGGPLASARSFGAALSMLDKCLIALALTALSLIGIYMAG
jgi:predicted component of type VI protein secretion system